MRSRVLFINRSISVSLEFVNNIDKYHKYWNVPILMNVPGNLKVPGTFPIESQEPGTPTLALLKGGEEKSPFVLSLSAYLKFA